LLVLAGLAVVALVEPMARLEQHFWAAAAAAAAIQLEMPAVTAVLGLSFCLYQAHFTAAPRPAPRRYSLGP